MDVKIISTEAIKPSFLTPKHLTTYKLSLFDQLFSNIHMPLVFFFSAKHQDFRKISDLLKQSLSITLAHYYPLAGRFNVDSISVECNDHGAAFIEAHVKADISKFLQPPSMELLRELTPSMTKIEESEISKRELLLVQVNYFSSGEIAIGVRVWHGLVDGSAFCNFMKLWGEVTRGVNVNANEDIFNVVLDCSSLFPPQSSLNYHMMKPQLSPNIVSKRLLFDGKKIASLKEKVNKEMGSFDGQQASRFSVVSALIWGAYMAIDRERRRACAMNYTMSLRNKVNPPIDPKCIGNIFRFVRAEWSVEDAIEVTELVKEVIKAKRMGREAVNSIDYLDFVKDMNEEWADLRSINVTSLTGMHFYEADFGWGKPFWFSMGAVRIQNNFSVICSTSDGEGMEAWVMMLKEDMDKFERDANILAYASSNPSIFTEK